MSNLLPVSACVLPLPANLNAKEMSSSASEFHVNFPHQLLEIMQAAVY